MHGAHPMQRMCGAEISTQAARCPKCGYKSMFTGCSGCLLAVAALFVLFVGGCALLAIIGSLLPKRTSAPTTTAASDSDFQRRLAAARAWTPAPDPVSAGLDTLSYWAGYRAGHASARIPLGDRPAMHRRCDAEIAEHHYDKKSYDEGFVAGTYDADNGRERSLP